ncbi:SidA/IucD/PvdA family monooxygenase [Microbacterium sp. NPDC090007]|uniref:SidA/IucD/PvdA family monooxygenase n=1 Tax=Microbacterium sp. NPDC090007 TaxID=3364204 RepID=UPI0037F1C29D
MIYDIIVLGAGAKAAAVAAKIHAVNEVSGRRLLTALILEKQQPASHWLGDDGFTSGTERLGTRPEKDVGYPYASDAAFPEHLGSVEREMQRFSWSAYLRAEGEYARWVDRGAPAVTHHRFGRYLAWVHAQATNGVASSLGQITRIGRDEPFWEVEFTEPGGATHTALGRSLLITGPGSPREVPGNAMGEILTAASTRNDLAASVVTDDAHVVVVGGGESAASAAITVLGRLGASGHVSLIAPTHPRERSETFLDNAVYTDPTAAGWTSMTFAERAAFIKRTDRGVMSPTMLETLTSDERVTFVRGKVSEVTRTSDSAFEVSFGPRAQKLIADVVVNCSGFDTVSQLRGLFDSNAFAYVTGSAGVPLTAEGLTHAVGHDLSPAGLPQPLFVPALATLAQGPGFANLSCLGLLSNRIVQRLLSDRVGVLREGGQVDAVLR